MDLDTLRLFAKVMRLRGFSEVARTERVAPSSVSRAIAGLEQELGLRLFQRNTRKLVPTEAGRVYFERVAPLLDELEAAAQIAADVSETPSGTLRVTAPSVYGQRYVAPLLPVLHQAYPALAVELLLSDHYLDLISERIDVAIRLGSLQDSSLVATRLHDMHFHVCASASYLVQHGRPTTPQDVEAHECLLFPRRGHNLNWLFRQAGGPVTEVAVHGRCLVTHSEVIRQCALAGMGLALLPDWLIDGDVRSGALVALFPDYEVSATDYDSAVWLLRPSRDYMPLKVRVFIAHLSERLGRLCGETRLPDSV